jgi:hypothetical protein
MIDSFATYNGCEFVNSVVHKEFIRIVKGKVKESRNRPGVAHRVPGGLDSQIFMTFGT